MLVFLSELVMIREKVSLCLPAAGTSVAGVVDWVRPHPRADGASVTLYERKAHSSEHHGDPIADAFIVVARPNNCILALADGVNWGPKPRIAARCALHGCIEHLNSKIFQCHGALNSTQELFHIILRSLDSAQRTILSHNGTTTTLTVAMVCEMNVYRLGTKWCLCVVSVGDSPCYIYKQNEQKVYEITAAIRNGQGRDPRDPGGCLGANLGDDPDLANLICCFVPVAEDDIIFLTSDGISDNFDPVTLRRALPSDTRSPHSNLPLLTPEDRLSRQLTGLRDLLKSCSMREQRLITVHDLMNALISHTIDTTDEKRRFLEQAWVTSLNPELTHEQRRAEERKLAQISKTIKGKLDHATVVGYHVGEFKYTGHILAARQMKRSSPIPQRSSKITSASRRSESVNDSLLHRLGQ